MTRLDPRIDPEHVREHYRAAAAAALAAAPITPAAEGWPETAEPWWVQLVPLMNEVQPWKGGTAWRMGFIGEPRQFGLLTLAGVERVRIAGRVHYHMPGAADLDAVRAAFLAAYPQHCENRRARMVKEATRAAERAAADAAKRHLESTVHHVAVAGDPTACGAAEAGTVDPKLTTCPRCLDVLAGRGLVPDLRRVPVRVRQHAAPRTEDPQRFRSWRDVPADLRSMTQWDDEGRRLKVGATPAGRVSWVPHWGRNPETVNLYHLDDTEPMFEILPGGAARRVEAPSDAPDLSDFIATELPRPRSSGGLRALAAVVGAAVLALAAPPAEAGYIYRHKAAFLGALSVTPAPTQLTGSPLAIQIPAGNWPPEDRAAFDQLDGASGNMTARMVEVSPMAGGAIIQVQVDAGPQICGQKRYLYQTHLTPGGTAGVPPVLRQFDCGTVSWVPATFTPAGPTITITAPETWVPGAAGTTSNLSL